VIKKFDRKCAKKYLLSDKNLKRMWLLTMVLSWKSGQNVAEMSDVRQMKNVFLDNTFVWSRTMQNNSEIVVRW